MAKSRQTSPRRKTKRNPVALIALALIGAAAAVLIGIWATSTLNQTGDLPGAPSITAPPPAEAEDRVWNGVFSTNVGDIEFELYGDRAPQAVAAFNDQARTGFLEGTSCHRLTTSGIFVLQCGDPNGDGTGGPAYEYGPIENAPEDGVYPAGTLAMARRGNDGESMGSQFFIVYRESRIPADNAGGYTVFGKVTAGLDNVTEVAQEGVVGGGSDGPPATKVKLEGVNVK